MKLFLRIPILLAAGLFFPWLPGCLLKPSTLLTRSFLLSPLPATSPTAASASVGPAIGIGIVKLPDYLMKPSLAVRSGTNEISYLESSLWAERLDTCFQRTLAANLSVLLPTDKIRLSSWSRDEVSCAVYVSVDRFEVNSEGTGTLIAWWRIASRSTGRPPVSGAFQEIQPGPAPSQHPEAVAATLSRLTDRLSQRIAEALHDSQGAGAPRP
ncbi:MAG: hypothetical protein RIS76_2544 [Verrucomicrobiota bacterium]|jgi:uncharacterized protein